MIMIAIKALLGSIGWVRIALYAGVAIGVITAGGVIYHKIWERGYDHAIADIARQDKKAIDRATFARSGVLDCKSRGLRWDQSTGICERR